MSLYKIIKMHYDLLINHLHTNETVLEIAIKSKPDLLLQLLNRQGRNLELVETIVLTDRELQEIINLESLVLVADFSKYYYLLSVSADYDWDTIIDEK